MRIALVFDDLIQFGGAERLLLALHEIWPAAPVYTSVASKRWQAVCTKLGITLKTSFLQYFPFAVKLNRFYSCLLLHTLAFESFDFSEFDVVLSVSSRYAHGIITKATTTHVCYMNSPGRMFWEPFSYFEHEKYGRLHKLLLPMLSHLRVWDYAAAQRVDHFIANSRLPHARVAKYYKRQSKIIYPFVEDYVHGVSADAGYFLVISRLLPWKRVDIAVKAFAELELPLKIVGEGPDKARLVRMAAPNIEFLGYVSDRVKCVLLQKCRAVVVTQYEDFGLVPLEAMLFGKPVIAYGKGGVLETVIPGKTGTFFVPQDVTALVQALQRFDASVYNRWGCIAQAEKFSKAAFKKQMKDFMNRVYLELP